MLNAQSAGGALTNPGCELTPRALSLLLAADLLCAAQLTLQGDLHCETPGRLTEPAICQALLAQF